MRYEVYKAGKSLGFVIFDKQQIPFVPYYKQFWNILLVQVKGTK